MGGTKGGNIAGSQEKQEDGQLFRKKNEAKRYYVNPLQKDKGTSGEEGFGETRRSSVKKGREFFKTCSQLPSTLGLKLQMKGIYRLIQGGSDNPKRSYETQRVREEKFLKKRGGKYSQKTVDSSHIGYTES